MAWGRGQTNNFRKIVSFYLSARKGNPWQNSNKRIRIIRQYVPATKVPVVITSWRDTYAGRRWATVGVICALKIIVDFVPCYLHIRVLQKLNKGKNLTLHLVRYRPMHIKQDQISCFRDYHIKMRTALHASFIELSVNISFGHWIDEAITLNSGIAAHCNTTNKLYFEGAILSLD